MRSGFTSSEPSPWSVSVLEVLGATGNAQAEPGSEDWSVAIRLKIHRAFMDVESDLQNTRTLLQMMESNDGYKSLADRHGRPFDTFAAFCKAAPPYGLGRNPDVIDRIRTETRVMTTGAWLEEIEVRELKQGKRTDLTHGTSSAKLNSSDGRNYLASRLKQDHPDIFERLSEFRSVRAAAIEAGIVKRLTRLQVVQREIRNATDEERKEIKDWVATA